MKKKVHQDFWSVSVSEVKGAVDGVVDTVFKTAEVCQIERIQDDYKHWCLENPKKCLFEADVEGRIYNGLVDLFAATWDLLKLVNHDDSCYSDLEQMEELYRISTDMGNIAAVVTGFDYKWDQSIQRTHIKKVNFWHQIKDLYHSIDHHDKFAM
jgi:hypothetical protein